MAGEGRHRASRWSLTNSLENPAPGQPSMEEPMASEPQALGWSAWTIILVVVLVFLVLGVAYLAY